MNSIRRAFEKATTTTVKRLGMLSLLLVLGLTAHGLWLLHANESGVWKRKNLLATAALVAHTEVVLDVATSALLAVEAHLGQDRRQVSPDLAGSPLPALSALGFRATLEVLLKDDSAPSRLRHLHPYELYREGRGPRGFQLSPARSATGEGIVYVWKELPDAPQGIARIGVALPEAVLREAASRLQAAYGAREGHARISLLREDGGALLDATRARQTAAPDDLVRRQSLERTRLIAEVRLSHVLLAEAWNQNTAPLYAVVFLGTGLLIVSLLVLTRVVARHEREAKELAEVRALAQSANRSRGLFHAAMSHELSVPLSGIIGTARLLQSDTRKAEVQRLVSVILMSARNLQAVVREILERSAEENTETPRKPPIANPLMVGTEVVDLFYASAVANGLDLTFVTASPAYTVGVDAFDLRQVLANLVGNALKNTKRGGVVVSCTLMESAYAAGWMSLRFEVRDTGRGMSAEALKTLFTPFAATRVGDELQGSGLGLPIARRLVKSMGGELHVESTPDVGTRFWFELEVRQVRAAAAPAPSTAAPATKPPARRSDARVLVVEDNPVSAVVTETQLKALGYACEVTPDGEGALAAMAVGGYDLVLMDCTLPGLSGHDITRHWRDFERQSNVRQPLPIVALTAKSMGIHMQQCLDVGMSDFLTKPCSAETLGLTIEKWLRNVQSGKAPTT